MERKFTTAIVLAAGQGKRMGTKVAKQYLEIKGRPLLYYTLKAFEESPLIDSIILVVKDQDQVFYCKNEIVDAYDFHKVDTITVGGKERYDSVWNALCALAHTMPEKAKEGYVFIHDGARPVVTESILKRCLENVEAYGACVAGMPVKDTIKIADETGFAASTPRRDLVWMVQTPQVFDFGLIYRAYEDMESAKSVWETQGLKITDDAMVVETFTNKKVKLVEGSYENIKVTTPDDLTLAAAFLQDL
ncbi:MAG: 2-C-methyl-D-erythritol 4-phosphate cytidylyltransferase [Lachnospiraceae bacterium]|nr:2-C-methyl-D-erythritol 4-phosphate cytidylyltransferase [Lachnospiraceae bacterium]